MGFFFKSKAEREEQQAAREAAAERVRHQAIPNLVARVKKELAYASGAKDTATMLVGCVLKFIEESGMTIMMSQEKHPQKRLFAEIQEFLEGAGVSEGRTANCSGLAADVLDIQSRWLGDVYKLHLPLSDLVRERTTVSAQKPKPKPKKKKRRPFLKMTPADREIFDTMVNHVRVILAKSTTAPATAQALTQIALRFAEKMGWSSPNDSAKAKLLDDMRSALSHGQGLPDHNPQGIILDYTFHCEDIVKCIGHWVEGTFGARIKVVMPTTVVNDEPVSKDEEGWYLHMVRNRWLILRDLVSTTKATKKEPELLDMVRNGMARRIATWVVSNYLNSCSHLVGIVQHERIANADKEGLEASIEKMLKPVFGGKVPDAVLGYAHLNDSVLATIDEALARHNLSITENWWTPPVVSHNGSVRKENSVPDA